MVVKAVTHQILREPALAGEDGFQSADDVTSNFTCSPAPARRPAGLALLHQAVLHATPP